MKKIISIILIAIMIITLAACGKEQADTEEVKTTLPVTEESVQEDNSDDLFFNEADYTVEQDEPYTYPNNDYKIEKTYKLKNNARWWSEDELYNNCDNIIDDIRRQFSQIT